MSKPIDTIKNSIFSESEALADLEELKTTQSADYYAMERNCEYCGSGKECQIPWLEMYCLANNVLPNDLARAIGQPNYFEGDWTFDARFRVYHPNLRCHCMNNPVIMFNLVPAEAQRLYETALKNKVISPEQRTMIQQVAPVIQRMQQQGAMRGMPQQRMSPQQMQMMQQQQRMMQPQQAMQGYPPGYRPPGR